MSQQIETVSPEKPANGRLMPPKHSPFQPGQSGNPGGQQKGVVYVTEAYKRLGRLSLDELEGLNLRKVSVVEASVINALKRAASADKWEAAHAALKEITDRLEGKATQTVVQKPPAVDETRALIVSSLINKAASEGRELSEEQAEQILDSVLAQAKGLRE